MIEFNRILLTELLLFFLPVSSLSGYPVFAPFFVNKILDYPDILMRNYPEILCTFVPIKLNLII
jgi:hypothetical protein